MWIFISNQFSLLDNNTFKINILSFNAYGFKGYYDLVDNELLNYPDIVFVCRHWLKPCELSHFNNTYNSKKCWTYMKSSVDAESVLEGWAHGGMGWICNKTNNVTYKAIDIDNDRISGIQIIVQGKTVMNILDVYLPFHNGSSDQIELYGETLECLHSKIDSYHGEPIIIVGDFNATLPQQQSLSHN